MFAGDHAQICGTLTHNLEARVGDLGRGIARHFIVQRDNTQRPLDSRQIVARAVLGAPSIMTLRS